MSNKTRGIENELQKKDTVLRLVRWYEVNRPYREIRGEPTPSKGV